MGEVLEFKPKETVHILKFTAPRPLKMRKTGKERISVELHKVDEVHGIGQAWVPATNIRLAKEKLCNMIEVTEFLDA
tara:strand:- start:6781 stop:7011 length:231 start_codon:yes stop_codon:yes gene_type:complete